MTTNPKTPHTDLIEILRACPAEHIPTNHELAGAGDEPPAPSPKRLTVMGTPAARSWDDPWLDAVNALETRLGRRACGARLIDNTPCQLESDHPTGRCRYHGGFDLTGAPPENRNAYIHGLYSRRLKTCGDHCAEWASCPFVKDDIKAMPLASRPTCPYEQAQYNCALADALDLAHRVAEIDPFHIHIAHNVALLQVLINRAALELRNQTMAPKTRAASPNYSLEQQHVSPLVTAITRIGAELRKFHALLSKEAPNDLGYPCTEELQQEVRDSQPGPEPHQFAALPASMPPPEQRRSEARKAIAKAVALAQQGKDKQAFQQWQKAWESEPHFTDNWTDSVRHTLQTNPNPPP